jgi:hypothetical protein
MFFGGDTKSDNLSKDFEITGATMKKKTLTVRRVKAADVYKDIVRIDIKVRGFEFEESKIYKLTANEKTHLVSVRGLADEKSRSDSDICLDEKTRRKFEIENGKAYEFTLGQPVSQTLALIGWSLGSSDPLQRLAAFWGLVSAVSLVMAIPSLFGVTIRLGGIWACLMTYFHNALTYLR